MQPGQVETPERAEQALITVDKSTEMKERRKYLEYFPIFLLET